MDIIISGGSNVKPLTQILRDLREDNALPQAQIAKVLGTSQTMYARYERGANKNPLKKEMLSFKSISATHYLLL